MRAGGGITETPLKHNPVLITFTLILIALWVSNLKMDCLNTLRVSVSFIVYCNNSLFEIHLQQRDFCNIETSYVNCNADLSTGFCVGGFYAAMYFPAAFNLVSTFLIQSVND